MKFPANVILLAKNLMIQLLDLNETFEKEPPVVQQQLITVWSQTDQKWPPRLIKCSKMATTLPVCRN